MVSDILGGEIVKTELEDGWHYYNRINGIYYDFTESQFEEMPRYEHVLSSRSEAFTDTDEAQFSYLKDKVFLYMD